MSSWKPQEFTRDDRLYVANVWNPDWEISD